MADRECKMIKSIIMYLSEPSRIKLQVIFCLQACSILQPVKRSLAEGKMIHLAENIPNRSRLFLNLMRAYLQFSSAYLCFVVLKRLPPVKYAIELLLDPKLPTDCYILGRGLLFDHKLSGEIMVLAAVAQLSWRLMMSVYHRSLRLDVVEFVLTPVDQIVKNQSIRKQTNGYRPCSPISIDSEPFVGRQEWRIRPNRSAGAYERICDRWVRSSMLIGLFFVFMAPPIILISLWNLFSSSEYIERYPGCNPPIERLKQNGELSLWWTNLDWHRTMANVFDLLDNMTYWIDFGLTFFCVPQLAYLLNYDLLLYWKRMHSRLLTIGQSLKFSPNQMVSMLALTRDTQMLINDLFSLVRQTDKFMSDFITSATVLWLSTFAILAYFYSQDSDLVHWVVRALQLYGFAVFSGLSFALLQLTRSLMISYKLICSIVADERCTRRQRELLIHSLEHFTGGHKATYTIAHQRPFMPTTYLSIISWTFPCSTILENLSHRRN